jgi:hypothetical protein
MPLFSPDESGGIVAGRKSEEEVHAMCEELGIAKVREMLTTGRWNGSNYLFASGWLARKEEELEASRHLSTAETALSAKKAAWIAAIAAIIAAMGTIASAVIAYLK